MSEYNCVIRLSKQIGLLLIYGDRAIDGVTKDRVFFKDLSDPESPAHVLVEEKHEHQERPAISGNMVVWLEGGTVQEIHYTLIENGCPATGSCTDHTVPLPAARPYYPAVYKDDTRALIVWEDRRVGTWESDIYMYDTNTGQESVVCNQSSRQENPAIGADWISWVDNRDGTYIYGSPTKNDIWARQISTWQERRITQDERDVIQGSPAISGNLLVFSGGGIWAYDVTQGSSSRISGEGRRPDVDMNRIVWESAYPSQTYLHDLSTHLSQQVSSSSGTILYPAISGSNIVWTDTRTSPANIYHNRIGDRAQALAQRYAPELYFGHDINNGGRNDFEPRTVNLMVDAADKLVITNGEIFNPSLQDLIDNPGQDNYLDLPGSPADPFHDYNQDYLAQLWAQDYPLTAYSRVLQKAEGTDKTVIQYWLNYYYNNWYNNHEGDWEMVEVILNENVEPEAAAYSQHGSSFRKYWNEPGFEKTEDNRPKVYVAEGSHANYFYEGGIHLFDAADLWSLKDSTGSMSWASPAVDMNGLAGGWVDFAGFWGQKKEWWWLPWIQDGPFGPAFQGDSWALPLTWASSSGLIGYLNDLIIAAHSPVEIHIYDPQGNHVGKNDQGDIDMQIPGSEYFERGEDHSKNIVIRNADVAGNYRLEIEGSGEGTMDLKIQAPDFGSNVVDKNQYLTVPINPSTRGELNITPAKDYGLKLDQDNDGAFEEQRVPDVAETTGVDFTPPSPVADLTITNTTSGSATLTWTATGDDASQGTAFKYDLRYATEPITEENWPYAKTAASPVPQPVGSPETATVTGLDAGTTYYFAVRARDDSWQESPLSNIATAATAIPNLSWAKQSVYWASWTDYQNRHLSIDYRMTNIGTGVSGEGLTFTPELRLTSAKDYDLKLDTDSDGILRTGVPTRCPFKTPQVWVTPTITFLLRGPSNSQK